MDVGFERAYQKHNNEINTTNQKEKQDKPRFMMVKFQNVIIPMHIMRSKRTSMPDSHPPDINSVPVGKSTPLPLNRRPY